MELEMNFVQVLKECEQANGAGSKDVIKLALAKLDGASRQLMLYMQDPFIVFGVKKFDRPTVYATEDTTDINSVLGILDLLRTRQLTGNLARQAVTDMLSAFTADTANYIERILDKDPRAGFSEDTYNNVILAKEKAKHENIDFLAAYKLVDKQIKADGIDQPFSHYIAYADVVPTFTVQLADKCDSTEEFESKVVFPCQADHKYDGERTIAIITDSEVVYYNRSGKVQATVNGLFDEDLMVIRKTLGYNFILDGERCSDLGFTDTVNAKKEGNDQAKANLRFRAFFLMPLSDWKSKKTQITTRQNREALTKLLSDPRIKKIVLTEGREVLDYQDMMNFCNDAIDLPENKARQIEGLILKNWESTYVWDRSFDWTKVKRMYDVDGTIIAVYPGRAKTRLENSLGGITVEGYDERGSKFSTNVGSGFSDEQRSEIWENKNNFIGATVTLKFQEYSKSKNAKFMSLRFPVFTHFRDDK